MKRLVLVTGSRSIASNADAQAWLQSRLDDLSPDVVVTGTMPSRDESGEFVAATWPDTWAVEWAVDRDARFAVYVLDDGMVHNARGPYHMWSAQPTPPMGSPERKRWPLTRNAAMTRDVASARDRYDVTVLALRSSTAKTHGTEHAIRLCREAGLTVEEMIW